MTYVAAEDRYEPMPYRRCGRSGLHAARGLARALAQLRRRRPVDTQRAILRRAFDLGVTHFDLANNYGPPYGSAETNFGRILREDLRPYRDELVISTKAGYDMWPGPVRRPRLAQVPARRASTRAWRGWGSTTSTSSTRTASTPTRRSRRRWARSTPRCARARRCTRASPPTRASAPREAARILRELGTPLLIHQPSYSMLNRWIEEDLLDVLGEEGVGCIAFSPLAQGMLTDQYLNGVPEGSRAATGGALDEGHAHRGEPRSTCARSTRSRRRAGRRSRRWRSPGRCATRA